MACQGVKSLVGLWRRHCGAGHAVFEAGGCCLLGELLKKGGNQLWFGINFNVQVDLTAVDIIFGVKCLNVGKIKLKNMNHVILIAKMCRSIFKKTQAHCPWPAFFENKLKICYIKILIHQKSLHATEVQTHTHTHTRTHTHTHTHSLAHTYTQIYQALWFWLCFCSLLCGYMWMFFLMCGNNHQY